MRKPLHFIAVLLCLGMQFGLGNSIAGQQQQPSSNAKGQEPILSKPGRIIFTSSPNPKGEYQTNDLVSLLEINSSKNLYLNGFLHKPLTKYLQDLAPDLSVETLNQNGNFQFTFYIDDTLIYTENLNLGAGLAEEKINNKVLIKPLFSELNEDSWGRYLWMRFMHFGGEDAFTEGTHQLKIEIRPYIGNPGLDNPDFIVGNVISEGQIAVSVVKPHATEQQIAIQAIEPGSGWPLSKDSYNQELIEALNKKIAQQDFKEISSIVVIKNGALLIEEYFNGSERSTLHNPRSVGKSFASTMLGIAIDEGYIENTNQTISEFYDLGNFSNNSKIKANVTLEQLLTMSSGFEGDDNDYASIGNEELMYPTDDWVKFALDLPMRKDASSNNPWVYFTAGPVVLGDILHQSVPDGLESYAEKKLFGPLGITDYQWQYTPQNVANTAGGLQLRSLDFAKYGQLYKNDGKWGQQQIIPENWVQTSLSEHVTRSPEENSGGYGYLFWHDIFPFEGQALEVAYATGNGGNKIFIFKDVPLVIVITAQAYNRPYAHPQVNKMMFEYILPAVLNN